MLQLTGGRYLGSNKRTWDANGIFVSETEYHSKVFEGWHYHENNHITLILQGGNREQRRNREFESTPGEVVFYAGGELHRNLNTRHPSRNINIEFTNDFFSLYDLGVAELNTKASNSTNAKFALLKVYQECLTNDECSQATIHGLVLNLVAATADVKNETVNPKWVGAVTDILNDRWNENIELNELAKLIGVHPVTISKFFPKYFGCTLGEYVRKLRIERATKLISTTQLSLTEIAYQCGFFDQSHFIRVFKEITGFLPGSYKKI